MAYRVPVSAQPWREYSTPEGKKYYHNIETQATVWDMPEAFAQTVGYKELVEVRTANRGAEDFPCGDASGMRTYTSTNPGVECKIVQRRCAYCGLVYGDKWVEKCAYHLICQAQPRGITTKALNFLKSESHPSEDCTPKQVKAAEAAKAAEAERKRAEAEAAEEARRKAATHLGQMRSKLIRTLSNTKSPARRRQDSDDDDDEHGPPPSRSSTWKGKGRA